MLLWLVRQQSAPRRRSKRGADARPFRRVLGMAPA
jgi:hypothetical protein